MSFFNAVSAGKAVVSLDADNSSLQRKLKAQRRAMGRWAAAIAAAGVAAFAKIGLAAIKAAAEVEVLQRRFQSLIGDEKLAAKVFGAVGQSATAKTFGKPAAYRAATLVKGQAGDVIAAEDMVEVIDTLGEVAASAGADLGRLSLAYAQVAAAGRLQGDEARQFAENAVNAYRVVAEFTGRTVAEIREDTTKGKISFDLFRKSMQAAYGEGEAMASFQETTAGKFIKLKAAWHEGMVVLGGELLPATNELMGVFTDLAPVMKDVASTTHDVLAGYRNYVDAVNEMFEHRDYTPPPPEEHEKAEPSKPSTKSPGTPVGMTQRAFVKWAIKTWDFSPEPRDRDKLFDQMRKDMGITAGMGEWEAPRTMSPEQLEKWARNMRGPWGADTRPGGAPHQGILPGILGIPAGFKFEPTEKVIESVIRSTTQLKTLQRGSVQERQARNQQELEREQVTILQKIEQNTKPRAGEVVEGV